MCQNNICKTVIKFIVAFILVFLLLNKINWSEVWLSLKNINLFFIFLFVSFYFIGIMISAWKWQILARFKNFQRSYFFYFKTYLLGTFLNNFFPSFVGGDAYRIYALGKKEKRLRDSSTTIVVDRISGLIGVIFLATIFGWLNYKIIQENNLIWWLIIFMTIISISFLLGVFFFNSKIVQSTVNFLPKKIKKYLEQLGEFRFKNIFLPTMGYSFVFVLVGIALANFMLFKAFNIQLSFFDFLSVAFLTNIIASVPLSVGNVGIKEWAYIFLFGIFGVSASLAVAIVVLARFLQMLVSFLALPFYLQNKDKLK
jgi:uncharacterized protein (TIRG00374 family)